MTIRSGVATARRSIPRSNKRTILTVAGACVLFLAVVIASAHDALEKMYLERMLAGALGGDVAIGSLHAGNGRTELDDVHLQTAGGGVALGADRIVYTLAGSTWDVQPSGLHVTVAVDRLAGDEARRVRDAGRAFGFDRVALHVRDAVAEVVRGGEPALQLDTIDGTIVAGSAPYDDLTAQMVDGSKRYPLSAHARPDVSGRFVQTVTAPVLPLAPLAFLAGDEILDVHDGEADDVTFSYANGLRGSLTLHAVTAVVAGHLVHALAGPLTIVPDGAGTAGIDALLPGGIPVAVTGEVHDVGDWLHATPGGSRDLHALAMMFASIAAQPNLRWMNVDTTAPGITFGQYAMTTGTIPHVVQMIAIDPREPTLHFDTALADDHIISSGARTSDLGIRTKAVAGVNGDYFDIGRTYEPQGMLMRSGVLLHGPTDREALILDRRNKPTFAVFHLRGRVTDGTRTYPITLLNSWPTRDVAVITHDYGKVLPAAPGVTFAALEPLGGTRYRVTALRSMDTSMPVTFGLGFSDRLPLPPPRAGDVLDVRYGLDPPVADAVAGISSGPLLLKDGEWYEDPRAPAPDERDVPWPVIALGTRADGTILLASVDGRHPERSIGMARPAFAELLRGFGVTDAMALDSGGSVTMVARAPGNGAVTVRNAPSDNSAERYVSDALFVYSSAPPGTIVTAPRPHVEPTPVADR